MQEINRPSLYNKFEHNSPTSTDSTNSEFKELDLEFFDKNWTCFNEIKNINSGPQKKDLVELLRSKAEQVVNNDRLFSPTKNSLQRFTINHSFSFPIPNSTKTKEFTMIITMFAQSEITEIIISSPYEFMDDIPKDIKNEEYFTGAYKKLWKGAKIICSNYITSDQRYVIEHTPTVYMRLKEENPRFTELLEVEFNSESNPNNHYQLYTVNEDPREVIAIDKYRGMALLDYILYLKPNIRAQLIESLFLEFLKFKNNIESDEPLMDELENPFILDLKLSNTLYDIHGKKINIIDISHDLSTYTCLDEHNDGDYSQYMASIFEINSTARQLEILGLASIVLAVCAVNSDNTQHYFNWVATISHASEEYPTEIRLQKFNNALEVFLETVTVPDLKVQIKELAEKAFLGLTDYQEFTNLCKNIRSSLLHKKNNPTRANTINPEEPEYEEYGNKKVKYDK